MLTPTFENVSGGKYKIDNFVVNGSVDEMTSIQVLNNLGAVTGTYYWYNAYEDLPAGWFESDGETPAGVILNSGDCVIFNNNEAGPVTVTFPAAIK